MSERKRAAFFEASSSSMGTENEPKNRKRRESYDETAELLLLLSCPPGHIAVDQGQPISPNFGSLPQVYAVIPESPPCRKKTVPPFHVAEERQDKKDISNCQRNESSQTVFVPGIRNIDGASVREEPSTLPHRVFDAATSNTVGATPSNIGRISRNDGRLKVSPLAAPPQLPKLNFGSIIKRSHS